MSETGGVGATGGGGEQAGEGVAGDLRRVVRRHRGQHPLHGRQAHTTPADAADIAARAGARKLALHHLVPGTIDDHIHAEAARNFTGDVLIPDDGEKIYFGIPARLDLAPSQQPLYSRS